MHCPTGETVTNWWASPRTRVSSHSANCAPPRATTEAAGFATSHVTLNPHRATGITLIRNPG